MVRSRCGQDEFRDGVLKRDDYTCQMPHCGSKRYVQVHHIKLYSKHPTVRDDVDNGITLCRKCHNFIRGEEKRYAAIFLRIIASKYDGD